mgnify:CR=1 FL=1
MFETAPVSFVTTVIDVLGIPGLIVILWYFDMRRIDKLVLKHQDDLKDVLKEYKKDVDAIAQMYRDNVSLVKGYEGLAGDLTSIITLNTQTLTSLVEYIRNMKEIK